MLGRDNLRPAAPWTFGIGGAFAIGATVTALRPGMETLLYDGR